MTTIDLFTHLSDSEVLDEVNCLVHGERQTTARLIAALAELDARRLYLAEGCSSQFVYCTRVLHLSEHAAYGRIEAARAARKFPILLEMLAAGDLTLTAIGLLAPHLTDDNCRDVLGRAKHKQPSAPRIPPPPQDRPVVKPLAPERYKGADDRFSRDRRHPSPRARHDAPRRPRRRPGRDCASGVEALGGRPGEAPVRCRREAARLRGRGRREPSHPGRGAACRVDPRRRALRVRWRARRCNERGMLEFHHRRPFAVGGEATVDNIELRCRAHNQYEADLLFGTLIARERREVFGVHSARTSAGNNSVWTEQSPREGIALSTDGFSFSQPE